jgi:DHA1 family tetracycline resistance protein-like MFS transporter
VNGWWFFTGFIGLCLWGLAPAAGQPIMMRHVAPNEQGELQGAIGSTRGLATVFGPGIFTTAFAIGIAHDLPGAAWYLGAGLLVVAALPALRETRAREEAAEHVGGFVSFAESSSRARRRRSDRCACSTS